MPVFQRKRKTKNGKTVNETVNRKDKWKHLQKYWFKKAGTEARSISKSVTKAPKKIADATASNLSKTAHYLTQKPYNL